MVRKSFSKNNEKIKETFNKKKTKGNLTEKKDKQHLWWSNVH